MSRGGLVSIVTSAVARLSVFGFCIFLQELTEESLDSLVATYGISVASRQEIKRPD